MTLEPTLSMPSGLDARDLADRFVRARSSSPRVALDTVLTPCADAPDAVRRSVLTVLGERLRHAPRSLSPVAGERGDVPIEVDAGDVPELDDHELIDIIGRGGERARRRFEREVELVARLQNPAIVALIDSGVCRGRYFYVMEFVEGEPLDLWWRSAGRADAPTRFDRRVRPLLRTFVAACEAVHYAHQRGVAHRDLKPSNMLVDAAGRPHVLDFGLAKAMDPESGRWLDATLSEPGQLLGTLGYMPPEQARGDADASSVRSDVYSLGAILYELLTGRLPCDTRGPLSQVVERIASTDPPRPSSVVPELPRDLEAVVLKSLEKSPDRRYSGEDELAADVERRLAHEPVLARPAGVWRSAWQFARRNRALVGGGGAVVVALLAGVTTTTWQAVRATSSETLAKRERGLALAAAERARRAGFPARVDQRRAPSHELRPRCHDLRSARRGPRARSWGV
ncbi:MAG: serine/threonine protein kinase [Phycisphaerae bacterium]|jgi:serine/threonine protein kinase